MCKQTPQNAASVSFSPQSPLTTTTSLHDVFMRHLPTQGVSARQSLGRRGERAPPPRSRVLGHFPPPKPQKPQYSQGPDSEFYDLPTFYSRCTPSAHQSRTTRSLPGAHGRSRSALRSAQDAPGSIADPPSP